VSRVAELRALALTDLDGAIEQVSAGLTSADADERAACVTVAVEVGLAVQAAAALGATPEGDALRRALDDGPPVAAPPSRDDDRPPNLPSPADLARFLHRFGGREDVHARQYWDGARGGYTPMRAPLTPGVLTAHLEGSVTVGVYPIRLDGTAVWCCLDLDVRKEAREVASRDRAVRAAIDGALAAETTRLSAALGALALPCVVEDSGFKGRHFWILFDLPHDAALAHRLASELARALAPTDPRFAVEGFPKQAKVDRDGLGNLVKLPLGLHRRSGRWSRLLADDGVVADPWAMLRDHPTVPRSAILEALDALRSARPDVVHLPAAAAAQPAPNRAQQADLEAIVRGCPVVATLAERIRVDRRCTHDERVVLRHAVAHLPAGAEWFNELMRACPEVPAREYVQRPLRGNPISCGSVRKRIPALTSALPCHCLFDTVEGYPTPALYKPEA
jgi:hypothetical protein